MIEVERTAPSLAFSGVEDDRHRNFDILTVIAYVMACDERDVKSITWPEVELRRQAIHVVGPWQASALARPYGEVYVLQALWRESAKAKALPGFRQGARQRVGWSAAEPQQFLFPQSRIHG